MAILNGSVESVDSHWIQVHADNNIHVSKNDNDKHPGKGRVT